MAKFCANCGNELSENSSFCPSCGASTESSNSSSTNVNGTRPVLVTRNIGVAIILSIVTCGIYGIYWFIMMTDESNMLSDEQTASGGLAFLYSLLTCGIYSIYWSYKMGQKMADAGRKYNLPISDNSTLYLVLSIFGLSIVNYCLIQNDLNRFSNQ